MTEKEQLVLRWDTQITKDSVARAGDASRNELLGQQQQQEQQQQWPFLERVNVS